VQAEDAIPPLAYRRGPAKKMIEKLPKATQELVLEYSKEHPEVLESYLEMESYLKDLTEGILSIAGEDLYLDPRKLKGDLSGTEDLAFFIASLHLVNETYRIIKDKFLSGLVRSEHLPPGRQLSEIRHPKFEMVNEFIIMALLLGYPQGDIADKVAITLKEVVDPASEEAYSRT